MDIERILDETDAHMLVDETYIEFTGRRLFRSRLATQREDLFVVRARANFRHLGHTARLRPDRQWRCKERTLGNPLMWGINVAAEIMGRIMFSDENYRAKTYHHLVQEEKENSARVWRPSTPLKSSLHGNSSCEDQRSLHTAKELRNALIEKKLIIRDCAS